MASRTLNRRSFMRSVTGGMFSRWRVGVGDGLREGPEYPLFGRDRFRHRRARRSSWLWGRCPQPIYRPRHRPQRRPPIPRPRTQRTPGRGGVRARQLWRGLRRTVRIRTRGPAPIPAVAAKGAMARLPRGALRPQTPGTAPIPIAAIMPIQVVRAATAEETGAGLRCVSAKYALAAGVTPFGGCSP